jgi:hypothetical protein
MREETFTAVGYNPVLKREVVVRLTYTVGEGPRPDIVRWFLVREEVLRLQDSQSSTGGAVGTPPSG